jgi:hypothetical protein
MDHELAGGLSHSLACLRGIRPVDAGHRLPE